MTRKDHVCTELLKEQDIIKTDISIMYTDKGVILSFLYVGEPGECDMIVTTIKFCPYCGEEL